LKSWIRIRIHLKSWIRIRIKSMQIRSTGIRRANSRLHQLFTTSSLLCSLQMVENYSTSQRRRFYSRISLRIRIHIYFNKRLYGGCLVIIKTTGRKYRVRSDPFPLQKVPYLTKLLLPRHMVGSYAVNLINLPIMRTTAQRIEWNGYFCSLKNCMYMFSTEINFVGISIGIQIEINVDFRRNNWSKLSKFQ
jgi:hypothetical protein